MKSTLRNGLTALSLIGIAALGCSSADETADRASSAVTASSPYLGSVLSTTSAWDTGYCANLTVTNNHPSATATNWSVTIDLDGGTLNTSWNSTVVAIDSGIRVGPNEWNRSLSSGGGTATVGFCVSRANSSQRPTVTSSWADLPGFNTAPVVSIARPYYEEAKFLAGHVLKFAGEASDKEDGAIPAEKATWTILQGSTSVYTATGFDGTYAFPSNVSSPTSYTIRLAATDSQGATTTVDRKVTLLPLSAELTLGSAYSSSTEQTAVVYFTVPTSDIGKFYHFDFASTQGPLSVAVVHGDRNGRIDGFQDYSAGDSSNRMAWANVHHRNPQLEFQVWAAGEHTMLLHSRLTVGNTWEQPFVAPKGMNVRYSLNVATTSPAAQDQTSVYMVQEHFPASFKVDDVLTTKANYDFAQQAADYNSIFATYVQLFGAAYTKYGSTIGVTYPLDPTYPYCGDASSPITMICITMRPMEPSAFAHELGHVFTQAYPFVYGFDAQGAHRSNLEAVPLFLLGYMADPKGGGAYDVEKYWRYETGMLARGLLGTSAHWHDHLVSDSFPFLYKSAAGGWTSFSNVLKSYSQNYAGPQAETDALTRATDFYLRLANAIPDAARRQAFLGQMAMWGVPFASGASFTDADRDGLVAGLDINDADARINQFKEECEEALCVVDGADQNENGVTDEGILRTQGSETLVLGQDNIAYGSDRGTRRKLYLAAGSQIRIAVTSANPINVLAYAANVSFGDSGPLWWHGGKYGYTDPVAQSQEVASPILTFTAPASGVYTIGFEGYADHGVNIGDTITYTASVTQ